ncbi:hypothetical protein DSECCO2_584700 [anaerobic digester metagenome]
MPVSVSPSASLLSSMVTLPVVFQTVPLSVTGLPPSEVIFPPSMAEFTVISVTVGDIITGGVRITPPVVTSITFELALEPLSFTALTT